MKIDEKAVDDIAALARLRFSDEERADFTRQFADIVDFVEQLAEVDTSGLDDIHVHDRSDNVLAADEQKDGFERSETLSNAPADDGEYFLVPKVIAEESEE